MTADGNNVEEMMKRLRSRFKAAGLGNDDDENNVQTSNVQDETRCVTQLRTYAKLCRTMGAAFVINDKARKEIFDAVSIHGSSTSVLNQALTCLNLLLQDTLKDNRKINIVSKEVYDGCYSKILETSDKHLNDNEFCTKIIAFLKLLIQSEVVGVEISKNPPNILNSLKTTHNNNSSISNSVKEIQNSLQLFASNKNMSSPRDTRHESLSRGTTIDELAQWASGDLMGEDFADDDLAGPLVPNDTKGFQVVNTASTLSNSKELEEKNRVIAELQNHVSSLNTQLSQITLQYQADQEVHRSFVQRLQQAETIHQREKIESQQKIIALEQQNSDLSEELEKTKTALGSANENLSGKDAEFERMKSMISNQMEQARSHYLSLKQEYENTKGLNDMLNERLNNSKQRVGTLEEKLSERTREQEEAQKQLNVFREKFEKEELDNVKIKEESAKNLREVNEKLMTLTEEHGHLKNEYQKLWTLNETLKQQFVSLKMDHSTLLQKSNNNMEVYQLQVRIKALEAEKLELVQMTEMLLKRVDK